MMTSVVSQDREPIVCPDNEVAILLVDDDPVIVKILCEFISLASMYRVVVATGSHEALSGFEAGKYAIAIVDLVLSEQNVQADDGADLCQTIRLLDDDIVIVVHTGYIGISQDIRLVNCIDDMIIKGAYTYSDFMGRLLVWSGSYRRRRTNRSSLRQRFAHIDARLQRLCDLEATLVATFGVDGNG